MSRHPGPAGAAVDDQAMPSPRQALVERGLAAEQLSAKAYWRAGAANADHGEPERPPVS